jgi:hypothetical protein
MEAHCLGCAQPPAREQLLGEDDKDVMYIALVNGIGDAVQVSLRYGQ